MLTIFDRVPGEFVEAYDGMFREWGRRFREVGKVAVFRLKMPLAGDAGDPVGRGRRIVGVRLRAEVDGGRMVISPLDDENAEAIERHSRELAALRLN